MECGLKAQFHSSESTKSTDTLFTSLIPCNLAHHHRCLCSLFLLFGATPGHAQCLLLTLYSEMTSALCVVPGLDPGL